MKSLANRKRYIRIFITVASALAAAAFITFISARLNLPFLIMTRFIPHVGFSAFISSPDGKGTSVPFTVSIVVAMLTAVILVGVGAAKSKDNISFIGGAVALVGIFVIRFAIVLLGYLIWFIFSPYAIIAILVAMIVIASFHAHKLTSRGGKCGAVTLIVFSSLILLLLFPISLGFVRGYSLNDMVVKAMLLIAG